MSSLRATELWQSEWFAVELDSESKLDSGFATAIPENIGKAIAIVEATVINRYMLVISISVVEVEQ